MERYPFVLQDGSILTAQGSKHKSRVITIPETRARWWADQPSVCTLVYTMPAPCQLAAKLLQRDYSIKINSLSLMTKNKGLDYNSASFHMTTELVDNYDALKADHDVFPDLMTFAGLTEGAHTQLNGTPAIYSAPIQPLAQQITADEVLQQQLTTANGLFLISYNALRLTLPGTLLLNAFERGTYQALLTKWFEYSMNPQFVPQQALDFERNSLYLRWECFLAQIVLTHFKPEIVDLTNASN